MHKTLIIVDDINDVSVSEHTVLSFQAYLDDFPQKNEPKTRVINLCDTTRYLSQGYYCSLLAQARQHRVLPSVKTINDLRIVGEDVARLPLPKKFTWSGTDNTTSFFVFFGKTADTRFSLLASEAFTVFPCPILEVTIHVAADNIGFMTVQAKGLADLPDGLKPVCIDFLQQFTQSQWRNDRSGKKMRWDMAILVNPQEPTPPSDDKAIRKFVRAAEKVGFNADVVTSLTPEAVGHYDALFIRETTAIDHHTYRLARAAEREGLIVIDDTQSILRCCNKVYLQDAFTYQQVPAPQSEMVSDSSSSTCERLISKLGLPLVLKLPESSFSRGVYKAETAQALEERLKDMLSQSALVLVQEYVFTEFDWRIGVLSGKPIYACQYFMARNHWQIYHHNGDRFSSGGFKTMPTFEVPQPVLQAAIKAAKVVGDGLYGVDIKQAGNKVYVIEVNDNPSIDDGVEDKYLGKGLYELIMQEFADRLERRGR